jgi:hypothetical protein
VLADIVAFLVVTFIGFAWFKSFTYKGKDLRMFRSEAIAQFEAWIESNGAAQLGLNRHDFEIVMESETFGKRNDGWLDSYTLTRFLRTGSGRYLMFKSTPQRPYVKIVDPVVAKVVLKERYIEKPGG